MAKEDTETRHEVEETPELEPQTYWNHVKTIILILAVNSNYFAQLTILVGAGAFARTIASVIGGASLAAWPASVIVIFIAALSPPLAQAADYWGRKWFIVGAAIFGCVGNFPIAIGCIFIEGLSFMAANVFVPFSLSVFYAPTMNPFEQALCYNVVFVVFLVASFGAGYYVYRSRTVRGPSMVGFASFLIFFILLATSNENTPQAHYWGYNVFCGMGLGFCITTLVTAAQFATPPELIAITSGLMLSMRSVGGSAGAAASNAIFANGLTRNLFPKVAAAVLPLGLAEDSIAPLLGALTIGDVQAATAVPETTPEIIAAAATAIKQAYAIAFRYVFVFAAACSLVALIACAFLRETQSEFNTKIDAPIDAQIEIKIEDEKALERGHHEFLRNDRAEAPA
ncbi:hypothetical protein B0A52_07323 [Exophiala mesophila]|uniref:Major facilitator superfamily (MFS) profile domain-containing protein n=1 Tax=Exophiala mesophila TaxID=212818 RepID=A0A438MZ79_EXOME|nr:hypothetical protein B0A52_07323 [Exophiala mesophila]